jgi:hypothetical protein
VALAHQAGQIKLANFIFFPIISGKGTDLLVFENIADGRVARFFMVKHTKMLIIYTKLSSTLPDGQKYSNSRKIDQMAIKYTKIYHCKALQNLPK